MPPKKEEKKAKPAAAKIVADKVKNCSLLWPETCADASDLDLWHEKIKKEHKHRSKFKQFNHKLPKPKPRTKKKKEAEKAQREKEKAAAEQAKRETAELFKPVQVQKVPFGVDPKTVVCTFYKQGNCEKGRKCKFSHDLSMERKGEKKNLYQDTREGMKEGEEEAKKKDDMADWDEAKLREVVTSKHGNPKTTTDKVCKYFINAVEEGKYGWFWTCPNGGDKCMYKHSLPPGFVLKTKEQRAAEKALMDKSPLKTLTLEDFLESERHKLTGTLTPVTPETFAKWKKERLDKKAAEDEARIAKEATGRAMFEKGGWEDSEEEDESENEGDEEDDADWDMESMRRETEKIREENEKNRLEGVGGQVADETDINGHDEEDGAVGVDEVETNGVNGHGEEEDDDDDT